VENRFRREVLQGISLKSNRFGFEPEITAKVAKGKWRVYEVPVSYAGRTYEEGKNNVERRSSGLMVHRSISIQGLAEVGTSRRVRRVHYADPSI
jgi:hypothetical protein